MPEAAPLVPSPAMKPEISVVVPSHRRPIRLLWLLNALEEQTLPRDRWEAIVVHDAGDEEITALLGGHPLAAAGVLRPIGLERPEASLKRNAGWRAARAPVVAFTDDDCRPPADWVENALAAARAHPGAVIQGQTMPDPDEADVEQAAPHVTSQWIVPPHPSGQTCNIVYPREVLERVGGFDEERPMAVGEDTDLLMRARKAGAPYVGVPEVLTYHAVEARTLPSRLRFAARWGGLAELMRRHPELRSEVPLRIFWKPTHPRLLLGAAGVGLAIARRRPGWALLALPWVRATWPWHGRHPRGVARSLSELPARLAIDATEVLALAAGSVRHRSLFL